jgi:hypothetical protein
MERNDSARLEAGAEWCFGREVGMERSASALQRRPPPTPVEVFRDLGMSRSAIAAYFRRFPDWHRS